MISQLQSQHDALTNEHYRLATIARPVGYDYGDLDAVFDSLRRVEDELNNAIKVAEEKRCVIDHRYS